MKPKTYKYEINDVEMEFDHSLTDAEMRHWFLETTRPPIDWLSHGVIVRGTFDKLGMPTGWKLDKSKITDGRGPITITDIICFLNDDLKCCPILAIKLESYDVYLRGQFCQELTDERERCRGISSPHP